MYYRSGPEAVIFERSEFLAAVAPAFAAVIGRGITADCTSLCWDDRYGLMQIRPTFGGRKIACNISVVPPYIATVRPGAFMSAVPPDGTVVIQDIAPPKADSAFTLLSTAAEPSGTVNLTAAHIIFSGGMGLRTKAPAACAALRSRTGCVQSGGRGRLCRLLPSGRPNRQHGAAEALCRFRHIRSGAASQRNDRGEKNSCDQH